MRTVHLRERVQIDAENIDAVLLLDIVVDVAEARQNLLRRIPDLPLRRGGVFPLLAGGFFRLLRALLLLHAVHEPVGEDVVLQPQIPELFELGAVFRARRLGAVEHEALVEREIKRLLQPFFGEGAELAVPGAETVVNLEGKRAVAGLKLPAEQIPVGGELRNILLREIDLRRVELIEILVEQLLRQPGVERLLPVVVPRQKLRHDAGDQRELLVSVFISLRRSRRNRQPGGEQNKSKQQLQKFSAHYKTPPVLCISTPCCQDK